MIIYLSFFQSKVQHPIPAYSFWEFYIKNGIEESGHEWTEGNGDWAEGLLYSFDKAKLESWKAETWEDTLRDIKLKHRQKPISFFLSYLYPHQIDEQAIKEIQKMGIPCVNFFCDNVREFTSVPKEYAVFDLNWVPEYKALHMYKRAKYKHIHLPMPMWVAPQFRNVSNVESDVVSFIGSKDIQRLMLFEKVVNLGVELKIYGAGWENSDIKIESIKNSNTFSTVLNQFDFIIRFGLEAFFRKLEQRKFNTKLSDSLQRCMNTKPDFDSYIKITKESAITLGVNRYPSFLYPFDKPNTYSRLRDIEAPMLGACYLTEWTEGLGQMYGLGDEIETYKDEYELIEKIKMLKSDAKRRKNMRLNAQKKALEQHSVPNSIQLIFNNLS